MTRRLYHIILLCVAFLPALWAADGEYRYQRADGRQGCVRLLATSDSTAVLQYWLADSLCSEWPVDAPVFRFQCADLTGNGLPEIALGVVRQSRYARYTSRRLWLLKLYDEEVIRPLWLSSRLTHDLIDFQLEPKADSTASHQPYVIRTWQRTEQGDTIQLRYRHKGFGLVTVKP